MQIENEESNPYLNGDMHWLSYHVGPTRSSTGMWYNMVQG